MIGIPSIGKKPPRRLPGNMPPPPGMQGRNLRRVRGDDTASKSAPEANVSAVLHERSDDEDNETSSSDEARRSDPSDTSSVESDTSDTSLTAFREQQALAHDQSRGSNDPPR